MKKQAQETLFDVVKRGDMTAIEQFIQANPQSIVETNDYGETVLHNALSNHANPEIIYYLIDNGADIQAVNHAHRAPLDVAFEFNADKEIVEYLLAKGAQLNMTAEYFIQGHLQSEYVSNTLKALLSQITGYAIPEPKPLPKYPACTIPYAVWRKIQTRLKRAFQDLDKQGILALHHAGYTKSDGWVECHERLSQCASSHHYQACCFYTHQHSTQARHQGELYLNFGSVNDDEHDLPIYAEKIVTTLLQYDLEAEWNGDVNQCIVIWLQPWVNQ